MSSLLRLLVFVTAGLLAAPVLFAAAPPPPPVETKLALLAAGRAAQGNHLAALNALMELVGSAAPRATITPENDRKRALRPDVWARRFLIDMIAGATVDQRKAIDKALLGKWRNARLKTDEKAIRGLIALVGVDRPLGREVRLHQARLLAVRGYHPGADQLLQEVRRGPDAVDAARALLEETQMLTRAGLLRDAVACYRILGQQHAKTQVLPGRTGADFLEELLTDKRFLPVVDNRLAYSGRYKVNVKATPGPYRQEGYRFPFSPKAPPFFHNHPIVLRGRNLLIGGDMVRPERALRDLPDADFASIIRHQALEQGVLWPAETLGHLLIVNLGAWVIGVEPLSGKLLWQRNTMALDKGRPVVESVAALPDRTVRVLYRDGGALRLAPLALTPTRLCLATKNGLAAHDPVSGALRWARSDVPVDVRLFHDGERLFVVRFDHPGKASATAAYRLDDGASVPIKDFSALYEKRLRIVDGRLLVREVDPEKVLLLRLYDVAAGKDVWQQAFPAGSLPLLSEDPTLTGAVEPGGAVRVLEARTGKVVMSSKVEKDLIARAKVIRLMSDPENIYLAIEEPFDKDLVGMPQPLFLARAGLRAVPVNGQLCAFQRATGKLLWYNPMSNQTLLMSQLERLPVLLLAARHERMGKKLPGFVGKQRRSQVSVAKVKAIHKNNGKLYYQSEWAPARADCISWVGGSDDGSTALVMGYMGTLEFTVGK